MQAKDYKDRKYLSAIEAAKFLGISVSEIHKLVDDKVINAKISPSGQMRFDLKELKNYAETLKIEEQINRIEINKENTFKVNGTVQKLFVKNSMRMDELLSDSVHLVITS
ncbi:MAG: helix-turn-helix domain-containing protein, partial [Candidatus Hydrogenedens sp.]